MSEDFCAICSAPTEKILEGSVLGIRICTRCLELFTTGVVMGLFAAGAKREDIMDAEIHRATDVAILHMLKHGQIENDSLLTRRDGE